MKDWSSAWRTWQGRETPEPTNEECVQSCIDNAEEAARRESKLRDSMSRLPPGDPRINGVGNEQGLRQQIAAAASDQRHWREYCAWFRAELAKGRQHWADQDQEVPF